MTKGARNTNRPGAHDCRLRSPGSLLRAAAFAAGWPDLRTDEENL
jgi:hypothetical protein